MTVLAIDIGGTHIKIRTSDQKEVRKFVSGKTLTPRKMVAGVKKLTKDWKYDVITIGYPGPVLLGRPLSEPRNLAKGWVGFNFARAFKRPVKVVNDAAMQALGSYRKGTYEDYVGLHGLEQHGKRKWRRYVADVVERLKVALEPTEVVLGGGNVKELKALPPGCRAGDNTNAFLGGFRLWDKKESQYGTSGQPFGMEGSRRSLRQNQNAASSKAFRR